jgi:hypothetical protein
VIPNSDGWGVVPKIMMMMIFGDAATPPGLPDLTPRDFIFVRLIEGRLVCANSHKATLPELESRFTEIVTSVTTDIPANSGTNEISNRRMSSGLWDRAPGRAHKELSEISLKVSMLHPYKMPIFKFYGFLKSFIAF